MITFTQSMSVDNSTGLTIKRSDAGTDGCIPTDVDIRTISVLPATITDSYYVKGTHASSEWAKITGEFEISGIPANPGENIFYIKGDSGTITVSLYVKGY